MTALTEKELARAILDTVNRMGFDTQEFTQELMNGHRTLQQSTARLFLESFKAWAAVEYYDLRNEATVLLAIDINDVVGDRHLPLV